MLSLNLIDRTALPIDSDSILGKMSDRTALSFNSTFPTQNSTDRHVLSFNSTTQPQNLIDSRLIAAYLHSIPLFYYNTFSNSYMLQISFKYYLFKTQSI